MTPQEAAAQMPPLTDEQVQQVVTLLSVVNSLVAEGVDQ